jgi:hypothetical protein
VPLLGGSSQFKYYLVITPTSSPSQIRKNRWGGGCALRCADKMCSLIAERERRANSNSKQASKNEASFCLALALASLAFGFLFLCVVWQVHKSKIQ